jgi:TRAP-type C4-dicarboxylate transport system substrate-binding protein
MMKKAGVTVTTPPRADFVAATKPVHDEFIPKIGVDIVTQARATLQRTP